MHKIISIFFLSLCLNTASIGQTFIKKAVVEYEVKTNVKKTMGESPWAEMMKDKMPNFKTVYYDFVFSGQKSIYKFNRWQDKNAIPEFMRGSDELNSWYFDHDKQLFNMVKNVFGGEFFVQDSIQKIEWKLSNENRLIAGFNCRKAVGKIMDSVYVFAFYTDEIVIPGGPCSIHGLPGLILGMTIPRLYTSWIATKVSVNGVDETVIKPAQQKKYDTYKTLRNSILDRVKEWGDDGDPESKKWLDQFIWGTFL